MEEVETLTSSSQASKVDVCSFWRNGQIIGEICSSCLETNWSEKINYYCSIKVIKGAVINKYLLIIDFSTNSVNFRI
jgi:hypothetical protein